ncbi:Rieske 2Fe-2S domain-containing protein [Streptomyces odontomachi]|uniref:Rieske 2Fe-2S domain-containing protein n=1 Tax=Streptomyces odontomachi TaxID=2944940 RepID=UPI00210ED647|nr:Rieske (2Fe-2S) protein [Streptomyces sp. ODS25]
MAFVTPFVKRIEHLESLDHIAAPVAAIVHRLVRPRLVRNALSGTWLGHPLHPALTDVPIGAWSMATLLDTVGGRRAVPAAGLLTAVGVAAAVPAAASGLNDWSDAKGAPRRVGVVHAAANSVALGLYTASLVARCRGRRCKATLLGYAGMGALATGAYLGGHLTLTNAVNVNHTADEDRPHEWTPVLPDADLGQGELRKVRAGSTHVLLARLDGRIVALSSTCSHMGGPLEEGRIEDGCVICPWHGSTFSLTDGNVYRGPATAPQPAYDTRVQAGQIEVRARDCKGCPRRTDG